MDTHEIIGAFALALLSMLGYFLRDAHVQLKEAFRGLDRLHTEITAQNLSMANDFVRKTELREIEVSIDKFSEAIFGKIDRLSERVDDRFTQLTQRLDSKIETVATKFDTQIDSLGKDVYRQLQMKTDRI
ncbi:hypothetical protein [Pseudomonas sp.]|uniref:hypothetical protein n=1 Tax=Pseudomonas sp. TaxID=306 RepID=UPI003FD6F369